MFRLVRRSMILGLSFVLLAALTIALVPYSPALAQDGGSILDAVRERGVLNCGVNGQVPGFGFLDTDTGEWSGFDVDFCRALAAALFGEVTADNLQFIPLTTQERFTAVQTQQVDVLMRNTTWTISRDAELGLDFGPTTYFDGQGLMVRADLGATSIEDLDGASIC